MLSLPTGHRHSGTNVLEEIADYTPKDVEIRKLRRLRDPFRLIVLEQLGDIIYLIEDSYIALKYQYLKSGRHNYKTEDFIQSVDPMLIIH